jgi:hypothetical protein
MKKKTNTIAPSFSGEVDQPSSWWRRNRASLAVGATLASLGLTFFANPISETIDKVEDEAPWVAVGMGVAEIAWIGGAAMMLGATGSEIGLNPLKIKSRIKDIARKANDSTLFKAGFVVNTTGAVAEFVLPTATIVSQLPVESWGVSGIFALDLAATVAVRRTILHGIRDNVTAEAEPIGAQITPLPEITS